MASHEIFTGSSELGRSKGSVTKEMYIREQPGLYLRSCDGEVLDLDQEVDWAAIYNVFGLTKSSMERMCLRGELSLDKEYDSSIESLMPGEMLNIACELGQMRIRGNGQELPVSIALASLDFSKSGSGVVRGVEVEWIVSDRS